MTAVPRDLGSQISPNAAATFDTGAEPNKPAKKRVMKIVWAFLPTAVAIEKSPKQTIAGNKDILLPQISETGAQHNGPKANPRLFSPGQILSSQEWDEIELTCTER